MKRLAVTLLVAVIMMGMGFTLTGCGSTTKTEIEDMPKTTLGQELRSISRRPTRKASSPKTNTKNERRRC